MKILQQDLALVLIKILSFVGSEKLKNYGKSLNATHTLEGKDNYGLITCKDLSYYWHRF